MLTIDNCRKVFKALRDDVFIVLVVALAIVRDELIELESVLDLFVRNLPEHEGVDRVIPHDTIEEIFYLLMRPDELALNGRDKVFVGIYVVYCRFNGNRHSEAAFFHW